MKIIYTPIIIKGAYKSFYNYIKYKGYDCEFVPKEFPSLADYVGCLSGYSDQNRVISSMSLFFVHSFIRNNFTLNGFERDYEAVKDDLPFGVQWNDLYRMIKRVDTLVDEIVWSHPDYLLVRSFEDLEFLQLYFVYQVKRRSKIKVIIGKEKAFRGHILPLVMLSEFSDYVFVGHGESLLEMIFEDGLTDKYNEDLHYRYDFLKSFNQGVSDLEIKDNLYNFSFHTLCPYKCVFCTQNKGNNLELGREHMDVVIDKLIYLNSKYDIRDNFCISSLPFYTDEEVNYFFTKVYDACGDSIKFNIVHLTTPQYLNNYEILTKFKDSLFYLGVEHFSDKILRLMKKPTSRDLNMKLLLDTKYTNAGFGLIYNFFREDMDDYNDMINALRISRKLIPNRFFKFNSFQYTVPDDIEFAEKKYQIEFMTPNIYKDYFDLDDNFYMKYTHLHDPDGKMLQKKNKIAIRNNIELC